MPTWLHPKLSACYYGPFVFLKQVGSVAYYLQLLEASHLHTIFYASQLKLAIGPHPGERELPNEL